MKGHKNTDVFTENISHRLPSTGNEDLQDLDNLIYCQIVESFIHDDTVENMKEQIPIILSSQQTENLYKCSERSFSTTTTDNLKVHKKSREAAHEY